MSESIMDKVTKLLCPQENVLIIKNEEVTAELLDAELDIFKCSFHNDMSVHIDTNEYTYLVLTLENIKNLKRLIIEAEKYFNSLPD